MKQLHKRFSNVQRYLLNGIYIKK